MKNNETYSDKCKNETKKEKKEFVERKKGIKLQRSVRICDDLFVTSLSKLQ